MRAISPTASRRSGLWATGPAIGGLPQFTRSWRSGTKRWQKCSARKATTSRSLRHNHKLLPTSVRARLGIGHQRQVLPARIMDGEVAVDEAAAKSRRPAALERGRLSKRREARAIIPERGRVEIIIEVRRELSRVDSARH